MIKGDSSAQFGEALEAQKYSFVNSVTTRVKNRAYLVGGRQSVGQLYERGLQPLSIRAVECYEVDREQTTSISDKNNSNIVNDDALNVQLTEAKKRWVNSIKIYDPKVGHVKKRVGHVAETLIDDQFIYVFGGEIIGDDKVPGQDAVLSDTVRVRVTDSDGVPLNKLRWEIVPITTDVDMEGGENKESKSDDTPLNDEENDDDVDSSNSRAVPIIPEPRRWHASSKVTDIEFAVFGGLNNSNQPLSNLCVFDALQSMWQRPNVKGDEPSPRYRHNMIAVPLANPPPWPPLEKPPVLREEGVVGSEEQEQNVEEKKGEAESGDDGEEDNCMYIRATPGDIFARIIVIGGDYYPQLEKSGSVVLEDDEEGSVSGGSKDGGDEDGEMEEEGKVPEVAPEDDILPPMSTSDSMHVLTVAVADDGLDRVWTWSSISLVGPAAPLLSLRRWYQAVAAYDLDYNNPKQGNLKPVLIVYGGRRREGMAPRNVLSIDVGSGETNTLAIRTASDMIDAYGAQPEVFNDAQFCKPPALIGHAMISLNGITHQTVSSANNEIDISVTTPPLSEILILGGWDGQSRRGDVASFSLQKYVSLDGIRAQKEKEREDDRTIKNPRYEYHGDTKIVGLGRVRHGTGVCKYVDRNGTYEGQYENDQRSGYGKYTEVSDDHSIFYEGSWSQNKRNGNGKQQYKTAKDARETYEGQWGGDDTYNGKGTIVFKNGVKCSGTWIKGKLADNKGHLIYPKGDIYDGEIIVGDDMTHFRNGKGKLIYANKEIYEGDWKFDKRDGVGKHYYNNGDEYTGNWRSDRKNGFGEMIFWNRDKYHGKWVAGKINGTGTMKYAAGHVYSGTWKNSRRHGRGRLSKANGEVIEGTWRDGKERIAVSRKK